MARRLKAHDPSKGERPKPGEVVTRQLAHPKVWETAIKLAEGDKSRLNVEGYARITITIP